MSSDPDGDGSPFTLNVRFPGQYYDSETGLHYNFYRTYDPATGRYLEPDPIGQRGGLNPYEYVRSNPLRWIDPKGLATQVVITRQYGIGDHAGVRVDDGGDGRAVLYDPGGSYPGPGPDLYHPGNDTFTGGAAGLEKYIGYQVSAGGEADVYDIPTTPAQEKAIADAIARNGGRAPLDCANAVGTVLEETVAGVSSDQGFPSIGLSWPRSLAGEVGKVQGVRKSTSFKKPLGNR